ncbi:YHYH domain-containing protein [Lacrimispora sp. BS-2]|uniref:YHYH domain-containing protein n=1 Tax=Lacrimispora sp. BS-2 TaxID=3151850 RepID=A0AAU7PT90_9FIRM
MNSKVLSRKLRVLAKKVKRIALFIAAILIIGSMETSYSGCIIIAQAHSGRTDSQGGHHDYKNKSGLGSYHYHHGQPAHLHPNGVCPYENGNGASSSKQTSSSTSEKKEESPLNVQDYKLVFDSTFYYNNNSDLQTTIGNNEQKLLEHFVFYGMAEGRKGCSDFDVMIYKDNNIDLAATYGDDFKKYYEHFMECGHNENRIHN